MPFDELSGSTIDEMIIRMRNTEFSHNSIATYVRVTVIYHKSEGTDNIFFTLTLSNTLSVVAHRVLHIVETNLFRFVWFAPPMLWLIALFIILMLYISAVSVVRGLSITKASVIIFSA